MIFYPFHYLCLLDVSRIYHIMYFYQLIIRLLDFIILNSTFYIRKLSFTRILFISTKGVLFQDVFGVLNYSWLLLLLVPLWIIMILHSWQFFFNLSFHHLVYLMFLLLVSLHLQKYTFYIEWNNYRLCLLFYIYLLYHIFKNNLIIKRKKCIVNFYWISFQPRINHYNNVYNDGILNSFFLHHLLLLIWYESFYCIIE